MTSNAIHSEVGGPGWAFLPLRYPKIPHEEETGQVFSKIIQGPGQEGSAGEKPSMLWSPRYTGGAEGVIVFSIRVGHSGVQVRMRLACSGYEPR